MWLAKINVFGTIYEIRLLFFCFNSSLFLAFRLLWKALWAENQWFEVMGDARSKSTCALGCKFINELTHSEFFRIISGYYTEYTPTNTNFLPTVHIQKPVEFRWQRWSGRPRAMVVGCLWFARWSRRSMSSMMWWYKRTYSSCPHALDAVIFVMKQVQFLLGVFSLWIASEHFYQVVLVQAIVFKCKYY